jgi:hypothetical protein
MAGCRFSPIPRDIQQYHENAAELYDQVNPVLQEGDIIFRVGHLRLLGGLVNYSKTLAWWCESPFAHAGIVYQKVDDTFVIVDTGPYGIKRVFLIDWLITGPENVVVKRLKPEHQDRIPDLLAAAKELIDRDVLHDDKYITDDDRFYCTEIVDHCFREIDMPLADKVEIRQLPNLKPWHRVWFFELVGLAAGIDLDRPVAIVGNEDIGLYSSGYLEEVLNLLPDEYREPPYANANVEGR